MARSTVWPAGVDIDRHSFPEYRAVPLERTALPAHVKPTINVLEDSIDDVPMHELICRVTSAERRYQQVALDLLARHGIGARGDTDRTRMGLADSHT